MRTRDFDYHLPQELIAQQPVAERTQARLMLVNRSTGALAHYCVADLPALLQKDDLLVLNDTRVIPARIFGKKQKTGGKVEVLFIARRTSRSQEFFRDPPRPMATPPLEGNARGSDDPLPGGVRDLSRRSVCAKGEAGGGSEDSRKRLVESNFWEAFLHSSGRPRVGDFLLLANDKMKARVQSIGEYGRVVLEIYCEENFSKILEEEGLPPLPPYIKRPKSEPTTDTGRRQRKHDYERYQTVYAKVPGAIAAPTAGLHFTGNLLAKLQEKGVQTVFVTLHVGPGTFIPVKSERVEDHKMEAERFIIEAPAARAINAAIVDKRRVIAVGTTVVRALESAAGEDGKIMAGTASTSIFIYPPYCFRIVSALLTNFHLPRSTLLMLVSAFAGRELIRRAYDTAVREKYRFYSYGDCMLIL